MSAQKDKTSTIPSQQAFRFNTRVHLAENSPKEETLTLVRNDGSLGSHNGQGGEDKESHKGEFQVETSHWKGVAEAKSRCGTGVLNAFVWSDVIGQTHQYAYPFLL